MKPIKQIEGTTWGSKNAEDMFTVATKLANFNAKELMVEIHRKSPCGNKVKVSTVEDAMHIIAERHKTDEEKAEQKRRVKEFLEGMEKREKERVGER